MRRPKYLSPSAMTCWVKGQQDYYIRYMSDTPPPREPQNHHMAIGNTFDAYVKAFLSESLFGPRPGMSFQEILESQVEPHQRTPEMLANGRWVFDCYKRLGAFDSLMAALGNTIGPPRFEMDVRGEVHGGKEGDIRGVPFRVKPDLFFVNEHNAHCILDWKVNGFFSSAGKSPEKGYVCLREDGERPCAHEEARVRPHLGLFLNEAKGLEHYSEEWARQCTIGSVMCGEEVGAPFVSIIHQIVCAPPLRKTIEKKFPRIRVAEHVAYVSKDFQEATFSLAREIWDIVNSDHIFRDLSFAESKAKCELLDKRKDADSGPTSVHNPLSGLGDMSDLWQPK